MFLPHRFFPHRFFPHRLFRHRIATAPATAVVVAVAALVLTGCNAAPTSTAGTSAPAPENGIKIVTSTNVWASIATAVGGEVVSVSAVLADPSADPHSFEATPATKLAMSDASVVLVNGGGYDDWAIETAKSLDTPPVVINAVEVSGLDSRTSDSSAAPAATGSAENPGGLGHGEFNEHVFYDLDSVMKVADTLATELGTVSPANAAGFLQNAAAFNQKLTALKTAAAAIGTEHPGTDAIATEPVVGYLLADMGIRDITPAAFSSAIETGAEVSVKDLADTRDLITSRQAALLFNNIQTAGTVTDDLVAAAKSAGVGLIGVTETLPAGTTDYVSWIENTINAVSTDLSK